MLLPRWARIGIVISAICFTVAAAIFAYRWLTTPVTLTVAVGSIDGEAPRLMNTIASRLPLSSTRIRLKVVENESTVAATTAFVNETVDLAVVRGDLGDLSSARTVVLLTHGTALVAALPGASIKGIEDLKGKTVGVVGGEVNRALAEAIANAYDLSAAKTTFRDVSFFDVAKVVQSKQVQALLFVLPITERYLGMVRDLFPRSSKQNIQLLPIEAAGAIAALRNSYETYELPKGAVRGSPPLPDEDMTTLRVPFYLVANKKIADDKVTDLVKAIMEAKRDLFGEYPLLAQVTEPNTDKAAPIAIHPGAAAFFAGEEKTYFERYGDFIFYAMMLFGSFTSLVVGAWKFMGFGAAPERKLSLLHDLGSRVRSAKNEGDLDAVEEVVDDLLHGEIDRHLRGSEHAMDATVLALAAHQLEKSINRRRRALQEWASSGAGSENPQRVSAVT